MGVAGRDEDALSAWEALLVCASLATWIVSLCIALFYWVEGTHYASLLHAPRDVAWLWLQYLGSFAVPGLLGWGAVRVLARPGSRLLSTIVVLACCSVPVLVGLFATRPMFLVPGVIAAGIALGIALIPMLVYAVDPQHPLAGRCALRASVAAPAALTAFNLLAWLRPSEFGDAKGRATAVAICLLAGLASMPILLALRAKDARQRSRRLLVSFAAISGVFLATIAFPSVPLSALSATAADRPAPRPSILLIVVDTLRADVVSGFGAGPAATPAIRALAQDAVVFTRAISAAPWTAPSFASLLSSTYPSEHRAGSSAVGLGYKRALLDGLPTLPSALRDQGYWTGSVLTNAYLGRRFGFDRGFDAYENLLAVEWAHPVLFGLASAGYLEMPAFVRAPKQAKRVMGLIRRGHRSGQPFFVLAHFMDPHLPYRRIAGEAPVHKAESEPYRREVARLDESIGTLLQALKDEGLYDDMLIVLTADHGEELDERRGDGDFGHGHTMYDEVIHVPLVVKLPKSALAGQRRDELASLIDVAPTILERVDVEAPEGFRGRSLFAAHGGERPIFTERTLYGSERKAVMLGSQKVVLELDDAGERRLRGFDLASDPGETRPIAPTDPAFHSLAEALEAFAEGDVERGEAGSDEVVHADFDPRLRQRLEALGYVQ